MESRLTGRRSVRAGSTTPTCYSAHTCCICGVAGATKTTARGGDWRPLSAVLYGSVIRQSRGVAWQSILSCQEDIRKEKSTVVIHKNTRRRKVSEMSAEQELWRDSWNTNAAETVKPVRSVFAKTLERPVANRMGSWLLNEEECTRNNEDLPKALPRSAGCEEINNRY